MEQFLLELFEFLNEFLLLFLLLLFCLFLCLKILLQFVLFHRLFCYLFVCLFSLLLSQLCYFLFFLFKSLSDLVHLVLFRNLYDLFVDDNLWICSHFASQLVFQLLNLLLILSNQGIFRILVDLWFVLDSFGSVGIP